MHHFLTDKKEGEQLILDANDSHHIARVLRLLPGTEISVAIVGEGVFRCRLQSVNAQQVTALKVEKIISTENNGPRLTLLQSIPASRKMDDIIRMVAELGVVQLIPLITKRCVVKIKDGTARQERWQKVADAAAKQSKSLSVMTVAPPALLANAASLDADLKIVFWEEEIRTLQSVLAESENPSSVALLIGPEGGLCRDEIDTLIAHRFVSASLGRKVLRVQTAPTVAVAQVIYGLS